MRVTWVRLNPAHLFSKCFFNIVIYVIGIRKNDGILLAKIINLILGKDVYSSNVVVMDALLLNLKIHQASNIQGFFQMSLDIPLTRNIS